MKCTSIPFEKLPFSNLFRAYTRRTGNLDSFFQSNPFNSGKVKERAKEFRFQGDRSQSVEALLRFNRLFDAPEATLVQIERLRDPKTLAVVTGQQLTMYGGPLFTAYKTMTAIIYARRWEKLLGRPVIPVFWLADEDHDFEEAAGLGLLRNDELHTFRMEKEDGDSRPVGRLTLKDSFAVFEKELFGTLPDSDFTDELKTRLRGFYREGVTLRDAFARWLLYLFSSYGLVLAGSDDEEIKRLAGEPMRLAAGHPGELYSQLDRQSTRLEEAGYGRQALVQNSNIFHLDSQGNRIKLNLEDGLWNTGNGRSWTSSELAEEIEKKPGDFSPNVFLRPLVQDLVVPTLAYVCGPGELSYYGQMKGAYEWMGQEMPMLLPRFSVTLKEPAIGRIMNELPFEISEYAERIEDLESSYLKRTGNREVEVIFSSWKEGVATITQEKKKLIKNIDPTLEASAARAGKLLENELDKLKNKTYRSIKKKKEIQLSRIGRVKENLFPGDTLQERQIAMIFYMNKYGPDLWDRLITTLSGETSDTHKVIDL